MDKKITTPSDNIYLDANNVNLFDKTAINGRLEHFLYALCSLDYENLPIPMSRIEMFANALITGDIPDIEPKSRSERFFYAILTGNIDTLPEPKSRSEILLKKIATNNYDLNDVEPIQSRYELLLAYLIKNNGIDVDTIVSYVSYMLNKSDVLYNTAKQPIKRAVLKGNTIRNIAKDKKQPEITGGSSKWVHLSNMNVIPEVGKKYLIKIDITNNTLNNGIDGGTLLFRQVKSGGSSLYVQLNTFVNGYRTLTIGEKYPNIDTISISTNSSATSGALSVDNFMIIEYQEGMENWDIPPHFWNSKSVKNPVLTISDESGTKTITSTLEETIELRGNGNTKDELNFLTGELIQRIGEDGEILSQSIIKTVSLTTLNQDGEETSLETFDDITQVTLSSKTFISEMELTVATKNLEDVSNISVMRMKANDILETQTELENKNNLQSENIVETMVATTEIYEQIL